MLLFGCAAFSQTADPAPKFEAASIKPSREDARGSTFSFTPGGGLSVRNGTLRGIIEMAYGVRESQIAGGPAWLNSDGYDIYAKSGSGDGAVPVAEVRRKLQSLLAERFQLRVHRETRELPVYVLAVAKNGPKLTEAEAGAENPRAGTRGECGRVTGTDATMGNLVVSLSRELGRPVRDATGLTGKYNFQFAWTPDTGPCPETPSPPSDGASIFTALQEQLGLKLEAAKGPVDVIVVDHAEKASEN